MAGLARSIVAAALLLWMTTLGLAADRVVIVLDASGSMWAQIDGKPKLEIARESLRTVLQSVPADKEIGFMAYGHREKGSCEDIELIVPPQAGSAGAVSTAADSLKFLGKTPLTSAVRQAAEALKYTEDKATVILITDGLETCKGDPCALGKELRAAGVDFTVNVVGFGLTAEEGKQVACLADNTGGKYIQASDEKALQVYKPLFVLDAGTLIIHPRPSEGADVADGAAVVIAYPGVEMPATYYGDTKVVLPAGDQKVTVRIGQGEVTETIPLTAGKIIDKDIVVGVGHVVANAYYIAGGDKAEGSGIGFKVFKAKKKIDGTRQEVAYAYGPDSKFDLPPDDYVLTATVDLAVVEQPFSVKAGEHQDLNIAVNAGVLAITAPGASKIEIFDPKKDINGNRKSLGYAFDEKYQAALPAGEYAVVSQMLDNSSKESTVTITAGERAELTVQ
ncbi:MAG: VWA domain-containing protein [Mesorhizobium sp.]|uniref:vWA domain-containing protein n=1 Tax=Mesorhizobium sp. TaxID=1871066 RepID=UPI00121E9F36|nr:VWA domain-containing protein [Mesorhizobium sp.]TIL94600.1 MAG: VWA domain-containing protein [Mesorhizobium sp.]